MAHIQGRENKEGQISYPRLLLGLAFLHVALQRGEDLSSNIEDLHHRGRS